MIHFIVATSSEGKLIIKKLKLKKKQPSSGFDFFYNNGFSMTITGLGKISFNEDITEGKHEDINGIGLTLISASNMGNTLIEREFKSCHLENGESINRVYLIEPSSNLNLDVTMHFSYFDSELNGNQEDDLLVFKSIDEGNEWSKKGGIVDTTNNGINLFLYLSALILFSSLSNILSTKI